MLILNIRNKAKKEDKLTKQREKEVVCIHMEGIFRHFTQRTYIRKLSLDNFSQCKLTQTCLERVSLDTV